MGQRTSEDAVGVVGTDVQVAHRSVRSDRTGTREATDDFGARGHRQGRTSVDNHVGVVGDTVQETRRGGADLDNARTRDRQITREGIRTDEADDGAARADEVHVTRTCDTTEVGAVSGVGIQLDVAGEDDVIEAEDASAGDIGGGTDGGRPRAVGRDDDLIHQVSAGGGARHIKVQRSIAGASIRIAEGDRTRTQSGNVADVDLAVADDGAAREGVSDRASHGQGTCARLDDGAEASQDVAGRVGERDINRAVINRDDGRGNRPGEGDVIVSQRGGVIDGDDVTVDELVGHGGRCVGEVQRGGASVPGVASCTRPGERTIAQLQVNRIARDREGR